MIAKSRLEYVEMPWFEIKDRDSFIGVYVDYLGIGNLILFPIFEVLGNKDEEALAVIKTVFPDRVVEPININEIASDGGLLNCISWTVLK